MAGRSDASNSYRFGFNGMEKDDDIKGGGNSLDFGARIYDSRLGRFLSIDPQAIKYVGLTPYSFAGNSPIMFIDNNGENPGPPKVGILGSNFTGSNSLIIYLIDSESIPNYNDAIMKKSAGKWNYIVTTDLTLATELLYKQQLLSGCRKLLYDNIVIRGHSGQDLVDGEYLGGVVLTGGEVETRRESFMSKSGEIYKGNTMIEVGYKNNTIITAANIVNYNNDNSFTGKQTDAYIDICNYAGDGGTILATHCSLGNGVHSSFTRALATKISNNKNINFILPAQHTNPTTGYSGMLINEGLILADELKKGFSIFKMNNGMVVDEKIATGSNYKLTTDGKIQEMPK